MNRYDFIKGKKVLVCTTNYKNISIPSLSNFKVGKNYLKFCNFAARNNQYGNKKTMRQKHTTISPN